LLIRAAFSPALTTELHSPPAAYASAFILA
jgi:hypothetical protein